MRERADEPVRLSEVVELSGASTRTLRYAFMESFGVSPKDYLHTYRLTQVRRQLRRATPRKSAVSEAANEWGFWHIGQFARDYRRMFGELPSNTLKDGLG